MNRKRIAKIILVGCLFTLFLCCFGKTEVQAASKAKYSYKKVDASKSYDSGRVKVTVYYKKPVLKGKSSAIKKINKAITKDCNDLVYSETAKNLYEYAQIDAEEDYMKDEKLQYYYYANTKVTYNKNGIISIKVKTYWYAGGVSNTDVYGLNYSLKTGKKLYLTNVCSGSKSSIKKSVLKKIKKDPDAAYIYWDKLNSYNVKKMNFYIKPGKKAVVCFGPYEICYGGWYRTYTIKSKYK